MARAKIVTTTMLRGIYVYSPYDALFVQQLKDTVPFDFRQWDGDERRWYVFESYAEQVVELVKEYWPSVDLSDYEPDAQPFWQQSDDRESQRGRGNWGYRRAENQQRSQSQWSTPNGPSPTTDHAALYVTADAPAVVIRAAYKALATLHHPDKGGTTAQMQKINQAYDSLKKAGKA